MIVVRLVLHRRNIRNAMGAAASAGELYKYTMTILVESYALFSINFLLFLGMWATGSSIQYIFLQTLAQSQVHTVLKISRRSTISRHDCLITVLGRSSPRTSSPYGSPTGEHSRATLLTLGMSARYVSRVKGRPRVAVGCVPVGIPWIQWMLVSSVLGLRRRSTSIVVGPRGQKGP